MTDRTPQHAVRTGENLNAGPIGGASGDAGVEYRRAVAAYAVAHALAGEPLGGLGFALESSRVVSVAVETDEFADDVRIRLGGGGTAQLQAKLTLTAAKPLKSALAQWSEAARAGLDANRDRLVVVSGSVSGPLKVLARVLDRLRTDESGALTQAERAQLDRIVALTPDLTVEQRDMMLRCGVISQIDAAEESSPAAALARSLLKHVVAPDETVRAWRVLVHQAGRVARIRGGFSVDGWVRLLGEDGIDVIDGATPARTAAVAAEALDRYRTHVRHRGTVVDLRPLGTDVAPILLADMDADVTCVPAGADSRDHEGLAWSLLRRRRILLTGLPGGGKTVAVAAAAATLVDAAGAPLPLVVSLRDVINRDPAVSFRDRVLDTAVRDLPAADRQSVRAVLERGLGTSETAILLDSLDETHTRRGLVVSEIAQMCAHISGDVPMLLATRDVAYAPAHSLGWDDLRLAEPSKAEPAVRAVLSAIGASRGVGEPDWVQTRVDWVMDVVRKDKAVGQTPLMPVLLAMLAADRDTQVLPVGRAVILHSVVQDAVRRRERERELLGEITGLSAAAAADSVLAAFAVEAAVIADQGGRAAVSAVHSGLIDMLSSKWGLPPGAAGSGATTILHFWDEAGVFVIDGSGALVSPRVELFLDIGDAVRAAALPDDEVAAWVADRIASGRHEPVVLAAGLNPAAAAALVRAACEEGDHQLLLAASTAVGQHAQVAEDDVQLLRAALQVDTHHGDSEGWRSFRALLDLPPPVHPDELAGVLLAYPPSVRAVGAAAVGLLAEPAGLVTADELDRLFIALLDAGHVERLKPRGEPSVSPWEKLGTDGLENEVFEAAAEWLLSRVDGVAPRIVELLGRVSVGSTERIQQSLRKAGHADLVATYNEKHLPTLARIAKWAADFDADGPEHFLTHLAATRPRSLTPVEAGRLDELADLYCTLDLHALGAWPRKSDDQGWWFSFVGAVVRLGRFDPAELSAEARLMQARVEAFGHGAFYVLDVAARRRTLDGWADIPDSEPVVEVLVRALFQSITTAHIAVAALAHAPRDLVQDRLADAVARLAGHRRHQRAAALALAYVQNLEPLEAWAIDEAVALRLVAAELLDAQDSTGRLSAQLQRLAFDLDREVATEAVENLARSASDEIDDLLRKVVASSRGDWTCSNCGQINPASATSCSNCHIVPTDPVAKAADLLNVRSQSLS